tara:strand:+ start:650 stop:991 length:342 start_codon:yes stop_codon:yes gene_type:complete
MKLYVSYFFLILAITTGVIANGFFLKFSEGFSKLLPSFLGSFLIVVTYFALAKAMNNIPIGLTYAMYGGLTTIGALTIGIIKFNQIPNTFALSGIILIIIGVLLINIFGNIKN